MNAPTAAYRGNPPEAREAGDAGTELFCELARTVAALADIQGLRSFTLPYPGFAQRALDRTVARCLDIGHTPPRSLPEMWEWCRSRTAADPLFGVSASFVAPDATLVHPVGLMPTRTCLEVASHRHTAGADAEVRTLLDELVARCGSDERFRRCRRFLARNPVVHQEDRFAVRRNKAGWNNDAWTRVRDLYRPVPEFLYVDDVALRCPTCGLPALTHDRTVPLPGRPMAAEEAWCEGEECPRDGGLELIRKPKLALVQPRSLRVFLALPQAVEEAALSGLEAAGIGWSSVSGELGAYRLRVTGDETVEVRIRDRLEPGLLAAGIAHSPPSADRTFVVVPQRLADRTGYRARFTSGLPASLRERMVLTTPTGLVPGIRGEDQADA
ncbi:pPIWI_RE_Y domain-containing protein [Streptomyces griseus]|uniref:pPIWI_RE_Y domain-containing protein n=1 Tax=Streptomyces griseus TaxID=1911 RepID=UPI00342CAE7A